MKGTQSMVGQVAFKRSAVVCLGGMLREDKSMQVSQMSDDSFGPPVRILMSLTELMMTIVVCLSVRPPEGCEQAVLRLSRFAILSRDTRRKAQGDSDTNLRLRRLIQLS